MRFPINQDYTDAQRLAACEVIFSAIHLATVAGYWDMFAPPPWTYDRERSLLSLRQFAFEWFTNYRIEALINDSRRPRSDPPYDP